ncbi:MAG: hypothetical protein RI935_90 [Candidatus Parcubacteria bacterium]|jgi:23S rRNA (guanosine2251-2'-O)-methyltransferase
MSNETLYIYGKNPIKEAILSNKNLINKVYATKETKQDKDIMALQNKYQCVFEEVTKEEIAHRVGKEVVHQGICASLYGENLFMSLQDVIASAKDNDSIVVLDEIEDPHNMGAIIRSALAFGASAVVFGERNQSPVTGTVVKSSSGALFHIPLVKVSNISNAIETLKKEHFFVYALTGDGEVSLERAVFDTKTVFVVGGEGAGIRSKIKEHADFRLSIPINPACESLNASNAVAVALYEWKKQNKA